MAGNGWQDHVDDQGRNGIRLEMVGRIMLTIKEGMAGNGWQDHVDDQGRNGWKWLAGSC